MVAYSGHSSVVELKLGALGLIQSDFIHLIHNSKHSQLWQDVRTLSGARNLVLGNR